MLPLTFGAAEAPADADHQAEDEECRCGTQRQDHDHAGSCCGNHSNDHQHHHDNNTTTTHVACNFGGRLKSTIRNLRRGKNGGGGRYRIASKRPQNSKRREKKITRRMLKRGRGHAMTGAASREGQKKNQSSFYIF